MDPASRRSRDVTPARSVDAKASAAGCAIAVALTLSPSTAHAQAAASSSARASDEPPPTTLTVRGAPRVRLPLQGQPIPVPFGPRDVRNVLVANPRWLRFHPVEYAITSVTLVGAVVGSLLPNVTAPWQGGIVADESFRDAARAHDANVRGFVSDTSDVLLSLALTYPFFVDAVTVAWWYRRNASIAWQMAMIDAEAFGITAGAQAFVATFAARERPYGRTCGNDISDDTSECRRSSRFRSFFSGHTTEAFTSAAVSCMHHVHMPLYGGGAAEPIAVCATGFALATTIGVMRIVSDNHYLSDVAIGAAIGTVVGLTVPLVHYRGRMASLSPQAPPASQARGSSTLHAWFVPTSNGAAIGGMF